MRAYRDGLPHKVLLEASSQGYGIKTQRCQHVVLRLNPVGQPGFVKGRVEECQQLKEVGIFCQICTEDKIIVL